MKINAFWFRRDLRLEDNTALYHALKSKLPVLPVFIFDSNILSELPKNDARVTFIRETLVGINSRLKKLGSGILVRQGDPVEVWKTLLREFDIKDIFLNGDYEPYAIHRDSQIKELTEINGSGFRTFKDQVIFEGSEILKSDGKPYTVFTPYKNKWLEKFRADDFPPQISEAFDNYFQIKSEIPSLEQLGFQSAEIKVPAFDFSVIREYSAFRDLPSADGTSHLSTHLRFGTIGIRTIITKLGKGDEIFLSELIWREFFKQIIFHFPQVVHRNFNSKYDGIKWRNNAAEFQQWCEGKTGYPFVDAGMRELNATGLMHNRARMVTAGFLCKHLLIDWRWGEAYFAEKLLDYDLSSNNGNWQWAAGTGCDAAPYFRIFNPSEQMRKFDSDRRYVKKWIPELDSENYPQPMVDHNMARERAIREYKLGFLR